LYKTVVLSSLLTLEPITQNGYFRRKADIASALCWGEYSRNRKHYQRLLSSCEFKPLSIWPTWVI